MCHCGRVQEPSLGRGGCGVRSCSQGEARAADIHRSAATGTEEHQGAEETGPRLSWAPSREAEEEAQGPGGVCH